MTVYVFAAVANFYEGAAGGSGHHSPVETDTPEAGEYQQPQDPDGFLPEPKSCEDVAFLLRDYEEKRDKYRFITDTLEKIESIGSIKDILEDILFVGGIVGLGTVAARYAAAKAVVEAAAARIILRIGPVAAIAATTYAILWLTSRGTEGRWDLRISSLKEKQKDWKCAVQRKNSLHLASSLCLGNSVGACPSIG